MAESLLVRKAGGGAKITGTEFSVTAGETIAPGDFVAARSGTNVLVTDMTQYVSDVLTGTFLRLIPFGYNSIYLLLTSNEESVIKINENGTINVLNKVNSDGYTRCIEYVGNFSFVSGQTVPNEGARFKGFRFDNNTFTKQQANTQVYTGNQISNTASVLPLNSTSAMIFSSSTTTNIIGMAGAAFSTTADGYSAVIKNTQIANLNINITSTPPANYKIRFANFQEHYSQGTSGDVVFTIWTNSTRNTIYIRNFVIAHTGQSLDFSQQIAFTGFTDITYYKPVIVNSRNAVYCFIEGTTKKITVGGVSRLATGFSAFIPQVVVANSVQTQNLIEQEANADFVVLDTANPTLVLAYIKIDTVGVRRPVIKVSGGNGTNTVTDVINGLQTAPEVFIGGGDTNDMRDTRTINMTVVDNTTILLAVGFNPNQGFNSDVKIYTLRFTDNVVKAKTNMKILGVAKTGGTSGQTITIINPKV